MAVVVDLDRIDGASATQHIVQGQSVDRKCVISGLTPSAQTTGALVQAAIAVLAGLTPPIQLGQSCPDITWPNYLAAITPEAVDVDKVQVMLKYSGFQAVQWEMGACLQPVDSNKDNSNNTLYISYKYKKEWIDLHKELALGNTGASINAGSINPYVDNHDGTVTITQSGIVQRLLPDETVTYRCTYYASGTSAVHSYIRANLGKVNISAWSPFGGTGDAARTWLCEHISAVSRDGGITFELSVTFHYRAQTWDQCLVFIDAPTGQPPPDVEVGNGIKFVRLLPEGNLALPQAIY